MCGRMGEARIADIYLYTAYGLNPAAMQPREQRFNVCPKQGIMTLRQDKQGNRTLDMLTWWFTPSWAKDQKIPMLNAKSETVFEKPSFRAAIKTRRCIVPAGWFYEWKGDTKPKQGYYIGVKGMDVLSFAGIWETWHNPETDKDMDTVSILTTSANEQIALLHDRMPVILKPDDLDVWLGDAPKDDVKPLLRPYDGAMDIYPVGPYVNKVGNEGENCIMPRT